MPWALELLAEIEKVLTEPLPSAQYDGEADG